MKIIVPKKVCGTCYYRMRVLLDSDYTCHNTLSFRHEEIADFNDTCDQWMINEIPKKRKDCICGREINHEFSEDRCYPCYLESKKAERHAVSIGIKKLDPKDPLNFTAVRKLV